MEANTTSEFLKQGYHMPGKQSKTIEQRFWVETYKRGG